MRKHFTTWWSGLALMVLVSVLLIELLHWEWSRQRQLDQQRALVQAGADVRAELEARLSNAIFVATGLETFIESQYGTLEREEVTRWLSRMIERDDAIRNIGIAPDNRIEYIYPLEGNQAALGLRYRDMPHQWPAIQRIINRREAALAGPLELLQGGQGLIYRIPVFIEGDYWGMVSTVMNASVILDVVRASRAEHELNIQLYQGNDEQEGTFFGTPLPARPIQYEGNIQLPGTEWSLKIQPKATDHFSLVFRTIAYILLTLFIGLTANSLYHRYQRRRSEQQVQEETDRLKNAFVATVSHELRTPVTSILGSLSLMKNRTLGPVTDTQHNMLEIALRNAEHLSLLINDLLDIEKISTGDIRYRLQPTRVDEQVREAIESVSTLAHKKAITVTLTRQTANAVSELDHQRFQQIMNNLLSNAIKFSPDDSSVEVSVDADEHASYIAVRDHGPGIPEHFKKHLFHRFRQADDSDTRSAGGSGLGLAITKGLVEGMGGTISYTTGPRTGTSFHVQFPLTSEAPAESTTPVAPTNASTSAG